MSKPGLIDADRGRSRCSWAGTATDYVEYHDKEWGLPVADDRRLFEKLCLEGFQSGLSWLTILRKRDNFRRAFADFNFDRIARFDGRKVQRLLQDEGIVRHRGKIESTINNARCAGDMRVEFGSLAAYFWSWEPDKNARPQHMTHARLMKLTKTPASTALGKDLKKRGWTFVGPTTCYAFMQAMGLVNDHLEGCLARERCDKARRRFKPPGADE